MPMAEEPKQNSKGSEADASDLLGMWGSSGGAKTPSVDAEVISSAPAPELLEEKESLGTQFAVFLEELNIQPRHIFTGIGCLFLLAALAFGAYKGFGYYKTWQSATPAIKPKVVEVAKVTPPAPIVLTDLSVGDTGIFSTGQLGLEPIKGGPFIEYLALFRKIQNAYSTDINELLDKSKNRRATLLAQLTLLKQLHQDGTATLSRIDVNLQALQAQFDIESQKQSDADKRFFEEVTVFNGLPASHSLQEFIGASREMASLRANFKGLQKVQSFFIIALPKVANRIHAIELNIEPLVAGIKVYDVSGTGAELNLIIPVQGQQARSESLGVTGATNGVPFVSPLNIKTGKDFITQPGGGFENEIQQK